ncbi:hypothetical protein CBS101457_001457 [Exobasidium rhododendri]|nr:hypothetical protein CBS101457_001457 [Exobasidium rhododendri]
MAISTLASSAAANEGSGSTSFDIIASYTSHLLSSSSIPMPIASIFALCDLITQVPSNTTSELITLLDTHSSILKNSLNNPVPATAGLDLFARLVITMQWDASGDFEIQKRKLVDLAREFAVKTVPSCREKIVDLAMPFIRDEAVILTHSYSRVVMQILLGAAKLGNSIKVFVTESRPGGLGLKTYRELTAAGIPTTVICDSAAAYVGEKIDFVLVGAEGVCESGGILNAVGTLGLALVAKSYGKPFFAAAESYKFLRIFPLSQFDLPTSRPTLKFADPHEDTAKNADNTQEERDERGIMTREMEDNNPSVDYTLPDLVTFIFSDVGSLRPSGVGDALLAVYGGNSD